MHKRTKFGYMALGGVLVFLGMLGAMMSPLTAKWDKFGKIECTELTVVDPETGEVRSIIGTDEDGGKIAVYGNDGKRKVSLNVLLDGGRINVLGQDGESGVSLLVPANHASVLVQRKEIAVLLAADGEHGGRVEVEDLTGNRVAGLTVDEHGGRVVVWDSERKSAASLGVQDGGGRVEVWNKNGESRGGLWVNKDGNGVVSTRDENGWYNR